MRPLSVAGRRQVKYAAKALAGLLPPPRCLYSSPLVRARQTADCLAEAFGLEQATATPLLAPGVNFVPLADELARTRGGLVALVDHEPDLSDFIGWQLGLGARARLVVDKGAACLLELARPGSAVLRALYPLQTFAPPNQGE